MKDLSPGKHDRGRRARGKRRQASAIAINPPLSQTVIEGREERPLSRGKDRSSKMRRYRGHLDHLAGRDPDELVDEMRGP
jgi:hypothetical protein